MESTLLFPVLLVMSASLAINLALFILFMGKIRAFQRAFYEFITPEKAGEKSGLDVFVDNLSYNIGHSTFNQVRSMGAASQSAQVRGERSVDAAISQDLLAQANPVVAGLLDAMPGLKKVLNRNPGLADYALQKIMERATASQPAQEHTPSRDNGNSTTQIQIT